MIYIFLVVERWSDRVCRATYEEGWGASNPAARVPNTRITPTRRVLRYQPLCVMRDSNVPIARQKAGGSGNCCTPQNNLYCSSPKAA